MDRTTFMLIKHKSSGLFYQFFDTFAFWDVRQIEHYTKRIMIVYDDDLLIGTFPIMG